MNRDAYVVPVKTAMALAAFCLSTTILWCQAAPISTSGRTGRTITAIGYPVGGGATTVDLKGTGLIAQAEGQAKVEAKSGLTAVEVNIRGLKSPSGLGSEFLTYVLWAVSPEGSANNLEEVLLTTMEKAS